MGQNHVKGGDTYEVLVDAAVKSGDVVAVGKVGAVALTSAAPKDDNNFYSTLAFEGIAHLGLDGTVKVGDIVTIDGATESGKAAKPEIAADPKGKIVVGFVLNPISSASTKYAVKLTQAWL
jgi:predicted RecA/RadA family phage recombinase|nr:MAG TPA: protein of unknown function DUF2190 [Caudoviricetes sp.]